MNSNTEQKNYVKTVINSKNKFMIDNNSKPILT